MSFMPRVDAATTADWPDLTAELDRWGEAGRIAALWWRDDDAVSPSPKLTNLFRVAGGAPLALAVVPALAEPELGDALRSEPSAVVLQHGWRHADQARHGKKSEYPSERAPEAATAEIAAGRDRLRELFGSRALPVFVPPWNRIAPEILRLLPRTRFAAVSTMAPTWLEVVPPSLAVVDVHVDVTNWRGDRGFVGTAPALGRLIDWLRSRRLGKDDTLPPIGILTHHLVMDRATEAFLDRLGALIGGHPAARWTSITEFCNEPARRAD
jgi:hypothetical protein